MKNKSGSPNVDKSKLPFLEKLVELRLDGIKLTTIDFLNYAPNLRQLSADNNSFGNLNLRFTFNFWKQFVNSFLVIFPIFRFWSPCRWKTRK